MRGGRLRFCMVTTFYPPYNFGGDGIYVQRLANELAARGHHVEVVHCADAYRLLAGGEPPAAGSADHPEVTVHRLRSRAGFLSPLAAQQTGRTWFKSGALRRILGRPFDVIHYHNISLLGPQVLTFGRAVKLYTTHEYWLVCPTHMMFKHGRAACAAPSCFTCTLAHRRPPQWWRYSNLLDEAARHVDLFITPSRFGREAHERMNFKRPMAHLPNFVPDAPDDASADAAAPREPYFLFVGRLEKLKGLQTIIPAFREYGAAKLLVAGGGSYEAALREMAAGSDRIEFLGPQNERQLRALYGNAVALVVPSICFEMFPLVILEAFREGTPVIARDLGGMAEAVRESGGGLTFTTAGELVAALDRLAGDRACRDEMGRRGREAYRREWTVEAHLEGYLALIGEILERKSAGVIAV